MESSGGRATAEAQQRKRKAAAAAEEEEDEREHHADEDPAEEEEEEEDVGPVAVVHGSKHADGSIYRPELNRLHTLYHLDDTRETSLEPMRLSNPMEICLPGWTACRQHRGLSMLQIFSLKLTKLPAAAAANGVVQLYGFMALRDVLDPLRNYIFNRTRDDPYIIQDLSSDPFIYLSGPKRGVYLQARVLIEYDIRMKRGESEQDDLTLIDGLATVSELTFILKVYTDQIMGDGGAVFDISRSLFRRAVEATIEIWIVELADHAKGDGGLELSISGFARPQIAQGIKLFRGVVDKPCELGRFVVAAMLNSYLILHCKVHGYATGKFAFLPMAHGSRIDSREFDFATIHVNVTWSNLY